MPDKRSDRALRIERRNLNHFKPSAAALLLVLHHEYFLLNRQIALEALEVLFKHHTVFLSCGPFVLKSLLEVVEQHLSGAQWLSWLKGIELDWVTFPDLRLYPPNRTQDRDQWWFEDGQEELEHDTAEVDVDNVRGAAYNSHYDEHDHTGGYYDDNFYDPVDAAMYPVYTHTSHAHDDASKLDLLIYREVLPLFSYLSSPTFPALTSITLPLYFISRDSSFRRRNSLEGHTLPLKVRYWVHIAAVALAMLHSSPTLEKVKIKYIPWNLWASMDSCDDLQRIVERGVWFNDPVMDGENGEREFEGEAFRCVWTLLTERGLCAEEGETRMGLRSSIQLIKWDGEMDSSTVGDELEVVFTKMEESSYAGSARLA